MGDTFRAIEREEEGNSSALLEAISTGNVESVKEQLEKPVDLEVRDIDGDTPLLNAAIRGQVQVCKLLLERGADKEAKDGNSFTAIMKAACEGQEEVFSLLLSEGADTKARSMDDTNLLHCCAIGGLVKPCQALVEGGLDVKARDQDGNTAVHLAASNGHSKVVTTLVGLGAEVHVPNDEGVYPVQLAAGEGHAAAFSALVEVGADTALVDEEGFNVLHMACSSGSLETVKEVLKHTGEEALHTLTETGTNCLSEACSDVEGAEAVVEYLLSRGCTLSKLNEHVVQDLFLYLASEGDSNLLRQLLPELKRGRRPDAFVQSLLDDCLDSAANEKTEASKVLVQAGANPNAQVTAGQSPFGRALEAKNEELVSIFVANGAYYAIDDISRAISFSDTPLDELCRRRHVQYQLPFLLVLRKFWEGVEKSVVQKLGKEIFHLFMQMDKQQIEKSLQFGATTDYFGGEGEEGEEKNRNAWP